ncbi:uncharacterized protein LOC117648092 [Thrips palmi]|uniref:Uncharacterized protein LOC117648092 n=1 Tax=Thrips palmi TaxID=161013 RepID=A0A6P8Z153_THRPL|nr:uncharacterized protein LOC117648092 [Thrips palmi]XP_034246194.1 uncharacterized protein LOC117648092 [Thrips palmi]
MDAFPDELLLMVLSYIDDALTLLDAVPLVCKRWHRLSRDPGAWNNATVSIVGCSYDEEGCYSKKHENHDKILKAARILLHAPALRRVCFDCPSDSSDLLSCPYDKETMASALVRSRAEVHGIVFPQPDFWGSSASFPDFLRQALTPEGLSTLVDFLSRNSSHVRYLKLGHTLQAGKELLRALGQCQNLEELHLMLSDGPRYKGELRGQRLPNLKRLTLGASRYKVRGCRAFLRDLRGCVAQSVRHVHCEYWCSSSEDVLAELSQCVELRSLRCGVEGVAFVKTLVRLRSLSLLIEDGDQEQQRELCTVERELRACGELQSLQELRLDDSHFFVHEHRPALSELLKTLCTKTPNLMHLSTNGMLEKVFPETVIGLFKSLPRLESVHIDQIWFKCLSKLTEAEVGGIKRISGTVTYRKGEGDSCRAALEQFKRQRPELDCRLTDREYTYCRN